MSMGSPDPARGVVAHLSETDNSVPLVVDLDGTLVATDTLFESVIALIRRNPWFAVRMAFWLLRGKAALKSEIAIRTRPDPGTLPYRPELLAWLRAEFEGGRKIVLATGAHQFVADDVAAHLGLFAEVLGSSGTLNLKGAAKHDELVKRFGAGGYDYVGDSSDDAPVWAASRVAHLAGRRRSLPAGSLSGGAVEGASFPSPPSARHSWLRAIRTHQWVKNVLVFVPSLLNHHVDSKIIVNLLLAFVTFSFVAAGTYILNDLFDLEADRGHPRKKTRPFARGDLSIAQGVSAAGILLVA
jgi:phosphoglycolate phosphatase-like HAD superfamily hydrolase